LNYYDIYCGGAVNITIIGNAFLSLFDLNPIDKKIALFQIIKTNIQSEITYWFEELKGIVCALGIITQT
jgi:hypothetical protein